MTIPAWLEELIDEIYGAGVRAGKNMSLPEKTGLGMVIAGDIIGKEAAAQILAHIEQERLEGQIEILEHILGNGYKDDDEIRLVISELTAKKRSSK